MPNHGRTITKITQIVLPPPPRSLLRKMSPRTQNKHMNHAKNKKNSNMASRNEPLSSNMGHPFKAAESVDPTGLLAQPHTITGRRHHPTRMSRLHVSVLTQPHTGRAFAESRPSQRPGFDETS